MLLPVLRGVLTLSLVHIVFFIFHVIRRCVLLLPCCKRGLSLAKSSALTLKLRWIPSALVSSSPLSLSRWSSRRYASVFAETQSAYTVLLEREKCSTMCCGQARLLSLNNIRDLPGLFSSASVYASLFIHDISN